MRSEPGEQVFWPADDQVIMAAGFHPGLKTLLLWTLPAARRLAFDPQKAAMSTQAAGGITALRAGQDVGHAIHAEPYESLPGRHGTGIHSHGPDPLRS
jgi:hypothetical protein